MAIRMVIVRFLSIRTTNVSTLQAQDLGLHRAADHWQRNGVDLFDIAQKEERKQIWWSCVIVDK